VIAIHGVERCGRRARDNWVAAADKHDLLILAPEFDAAGYPDRSFQFGGMENRDSAAWTFGIVEALFDGSCTVSH